MLKRIWRGIALPLWLALVVLSWGSAPAAGADPARPFSGTGWAQFDFAGDSIHFAFIADFARRWPGYAESQARRRWRTLDLQVAYHDLNDDGSPEMLLAYAEVSSYYCGTGGCDLIVFQWRDGRWQTSGDGFMFAPWVSEEKVDGYRTLFTSRGQGLRWDGSRYRDFCSVTVPAAIQTGDRITCDRG